MYSNKSRKKRMVPVVISLLLSFVFSMFFPTAVMAHAPNDLKLDYDFNTQSLKAEITHTRFSDSHYINKVEIRKNGNLASISEYKSQPAETFSYTYKVTAVAGDVIEVKASCNKFGSKTEKITVAAPGKQAPK